MALYAGDAALLQMVEDAVRVTQDNDIAVYIAVGGNVRESRTYGTSEIYAAPSCVTSSVSAS